MYLGNLLEACFELFPGFILNSTILNKHCKVMLPVIPGRPPELVDVCSEFERTCWSKLPAESLFNFGLEVIESHAINGVLESGILCKLSRTLDIIYNRRKKERLNFRTLRLSREIIQVGLSKFSKGKMRRHSLGTVTVIPLSQHDLLRNNVCLIGCAKSENVCSARVSLLVGMRDSHTTAGRNIKPRKVSFFIRNGDEADIVGKDVNIVGRRDSDGNFELARDKSSRRAVPIRGQITYLPREIISTIQRLMVLYGVAGNKLLVQPDFMIRSRLGQKVFADTLRVLVNLGMKMG